MRKRGATGNARRLRLHARGSANLGRTVFFDVRGALAGTLTLLAFGSATDVDLAPLGAPDNRRYVDAWGSLFVPTAAHGVARWDAPVPNHTSLLGVDVTVQAAMRDPTANALGVVTSNAIALAVR